MAKKGEEFVLKGKRMTSGFAAGSKEKCFSSIQYHFDKNPIMGSESDMFTHSVFFFKRDQISYLRKQ